MSLFKKTLFLIFLLLFFVLGYGFLDTWWQFVPFVFLIIVLVRVYFPKKWKEHLGLVGTWKSLGLGALFCLGFFMLSHFVILYSLPDGYSLGRDKGWGYLAFANNFFQSLNEELVLRALLTNYLLYLGVGRWKLVLGTAFVFAFLHWVMFRFNLNLDNRGDLSWFALGTLFFFSSAMTLIFIKTKSIMIPLAFHAGWNFNRFSLGLISLKNPQTRVDEYLSFNLLEGSFLVFGMSVLLFFLSLVYLQKNSQHP